MADIFISYASADRDSARLLANALEVEGRSVWWDRTILPGKVFDQVIAQALDEAKAVMVLWSSTSIASDWVKEEIADAARKGTLVPVLIEEVMIPLGFRRFQAADLSEWNADRNDSEFQKLLTALAEVTADSPRATKQTGEPIKRKARSPGKLDTKKRWHIEIIRKTEGLFKAKIHLSSETHLFEWKASPLVGGVAKLDNKVVSTSVGLTKEVHRFGIHDGENSYHARFSAIGMMNLSYELSVGNIILYKDRE